jgi:hypothetical protein
MQREWQEKKNLIFCKPVLAALTELKNNAKTSANVAKQSH